MLINEIKRYIRVKSLSCLSKETGISRKTIYAILRWELLQKKTIDHLYNFFGLAIDNFYITNLQKRHKKSDSLPGQAVKMIRISLFWENQKEFSKRMGITERTLARIENWENKEWAGLRFFEQLFHQLVIENTQQKEHSDKNTSDF